MIVGWPLADMNLPRFDVQSVSAADFVVAEPHFMDTPEWRQHFARVLAEIAVDADLARGHVGSYG